MATYKNQCSSGSRASRYILLLDVSVGEQRIGQNTTLVGVSLRLAGGNYAGDNYNPYGSSFYGYPCYGNIKIRNVTTGFESTYTGDNSGTVSNTNAIYLCGGSEYFPHNPDGTLTLEITGTFTGGLASQTNGGNISVTIQIPTIPRATNCPTGAYQVGLSHYIPLNSASPNFTHTLEFQLGSRAFSLNGDSRGVTLDLTNKTDIYNLFGTQQAVCPAVLHTFNNGTLIGDTYGTIYINSMEADCRPTITATYEDINESVYSVIDPIAKQKILKNKSQVQITIGYQTNFSDLDYFTVNGINVGKDIVYVDAQPTVSTYQLVVYDTRGYKSQTFNLQIDLRDYTALTCEPSFYRTQPTNNEVALEYIGTFSNQLADLENAITTAWYYKKKGETQWVLGGADITPTIENNSFKLNTTSLGTDYEYTSQYDFKIVISDLLDTVSIDKIVTKGKADFYSNGEKFGINEEFYLKELNILDYVYPIGSYYTSKDGTNPADIIGGNWELSSNGAKIKTEPFGDNRWYGTYEIYDNGYMKICGTTHPIDVNGYEIKQFVITPKYAIANNYGIVVSLVGGTYTENITPLAQHYGSDYVLLFNNMRSAQTSQNVYASFTATAIIDLDKYGFTQRTYKRIS